MSVVTIGRWSVYSQPHRNEACCVAVSHWQPHEVHWAIGRAGQAVRGMLHDGRLDHLTLHIHSYSNIRSCTG
jgi:hypothetical protein